MLLFLFWDLNFLFFTVFSWDFIAFLPCITVGKMSHCTSISRKNNIVFLSTYLELDILAFVGDFWFAAGGRLYFTSHLGYHLVLFNINVVIISDIFSIFTGDFGNFEVNLFWDQFAFSPCDWFASFVSCPYLFAVLIGFPFCDTVLFCDISAFWHHFCVFDNVHASGTYLFLGQLLDNFEAFVWHAFHCHLAFSIWYNIANHFGDIVANLFMVKSWEVRGKYEKVLDYL